MAKVQHLKNWNPVTDAPGFGDTDEEEEKEEDNKQGLTLKANGETRRQEDDEEDPKRKKSQGKGGDPEPPARGAYGEEPLGRMQRPPEVTFQWYCHHKPSETW